MLHGLRDFENIRVFFKVVIVLNEINKIEKDIVSNKSYQRYIRITVSMQIKNTIIKDTYL